LTADNWLTDAGRAEIENHRAPTLRALTAGALNLITESHETNDPERKAAKLNAAHQVGRLVQSFQRGQLSVEHAEILAFFAQMSGILMRTGYLHDKLTVELLAAGHIVYVAEEGQIPFYRLSEYQA